MKTEINKFIFVQLDSHNDTTFYYLRKSNEIIFIAIG